ncbi:transmembrane signal receptor [Lithospermum erythrorhizon]|uniref:Transmembrane signal receptor n=1 Tax=Lithospermum erythrorhizon TaxID=34254 RepID=A0AAV3R2S6_LITER
MGLLATKPVETPLPQNHRLGDATGPLFSDPACYRRLIGRLLYLTLTRPDITYPIHVLSQFMLAPCQAHYEVAIRVLRYLKSHPGQGILLRADCDLQLYAYCDSDWASYPMSRRSVSGYFVFLGSSPVSWKSKKETIVARSSAEPVRVCCDNQVALHIASNPVFHERTKYIDIDCHFVCELLGTGIITTAHINTHLQLAVIFTKALGTSQFSLLLDKLCVYDPQPPP